MSGGERTDRVAARIQEELGAMLLRGTVHDPDVVGAIVSTVRVTPDLRLARVYVRLLDIDPPEARRRSVVRGLARAGGFLRREIGRRLGLRHAPELSFFWDEGVDHALRVDALLDEIHREGSPGAGGDPEPDGGAGGPGPT